MLLGYESTLLIMMSLGLTWSVLKPFSAFRELLDLPFPHEDTPLDFLNDPRRSGALYSSAENTAEQVVLIWVLEVKRLLVGTDFYMYLLSFPCVLLFPWSQRK